MKRSRSHSSKKKEKQKVSKRDKDFILEYGESHPLENHQEGIKTLKLLEAVRSKTSTNTKILEQPNSFISEEEEASEKEYSSLEAFKATFGKVPLSFKKKLKAQSKAQEIKEAVEIEQPDSAEEENCTTICFENDERSSEKSVFDLLYSEAFYKSHVLPAINRAEEEAPKASKNSSSEENLKNIPNYQSTKNLNESLLSSGHFVSNFPILKEIGSKNQSILKNDIQELLEIFASFADVKFDDLPFESLASIRQAYVLHLLNFLYRKSTDPASSGENNQDALNCGFSRPKILILAPFRNAAFDIVSQILQSSNTSVQLNRKRFVSEFGPAADEEEDKDSDKAPKPAEYKQVFYGNVDDFFQIGIAIQNQKGKRHRSLKLFSDFYSSDIIVASPIALRQTIGDEDDRERDYDFLSSIQMVIVDRADVFLMQNWDHLEHVFKHLNLQPKQQRDCDFSRLMSIYSDLKSNYTRQTMLFSALQNPLLNSLFSRQKNIVGKIRAFPAAHPGNLELVTVPTKQTFYRFSPKSHGSMNDDRFDFFVNNILNLFLKDVSFSSGKCENIAVFVSSYFDFVRLKRYFDLNDLDYENLTEYTTGPNITRCRSWFFHGQVRFLIFTERFMFFRRVALRGIRHLIFYTLPEYSFFYPQLVNRIGNLPTPSRSAAGREVARNVDFQSTSCHALFCKYDLCKVERIAGTERSLRMLQSSSEFRFSFSCE